MKKILNALFLTLLTVCTFSSCSDVPAPYDILGEGDVPGLTGDGTKENPYNIEAAQQKQDGSVAWVQGYIVGAIENVYDDKGEFAGNKASFTAPFTITSNVLIAESPDETNESKCLPVKIKNGSELSTALNLKDHPENKGGVLLIQGELSAGFGKAALINTTAAVFNNKEIGEEQGGEDLDPDNPLGLDTSVAPLVDLSNNFDDVQHQADYSKAGWINKAVKGNRIWQGAIYDPQKYLAASTYGVNSGETAEYWFVTPYFTVNADKQFTFKATVNKYSETMSLKVFFLQMKDGKMERHEISVTGIPTSGTYQWTSDLKVDLSTYAGQLVSSMLHCVGQKYKLMGLMILYMVEVAEQKLRVAMTHLDWMLLTLKQLLKQTLKISQNRIKTTLQKDGQIKLFKRLIFGKLQLTVVINILKPPLIMQLLMQQWRHGLLLPPLLLIRLINSHLTVREQIGKMIWH